MYKTACGTCILAVHPAGVVFAVAVGKHKIGGTGRT